jgi:glycosyltransferase involved in cell wall biosynthesis
MLSQSQKILIIHNHYQQPGGEQVAVEAQVALLRERGHPVVLYVKDNVVIEHYRPGQRVAFFPRTLFSQVTCREIRSLVVRERPSVAHVHNVFPLISPAVYRALKDAEVPIVQTVHNFRFLCPNGLFYTHGQICERCEYGNTFHAVRRKCYRNSCVLSALYALTIGLHRRWGTFGLIDRFIALTEFTAQKLVESGLVRRDEISVLGNFLPDPPPVPGSFEAREPYIIYLGRLSPEKGGETLLEAMAGLPNLGLKVIGDGPQAETLQAMAHRRRLHQVEFLGRVVGEVKWQLLRQALAMVVPSACYENFPFTILESLASGTLVVASNLGSLPYVVDDGKSGLLFRPGDSQDLRQKLAWLATHPHEALAMGRYGRQVVETRYSAEAHYRQLMGIYAEVKR